MVKFSKDIRLDALENIANDDDAVANLDFSSGFRRSEKPFKFECDEAWISNVPDPKAIPIGIEN